MGLRNDFEGEVWVSKGKRRMVVLILFLQVMLRPCPLGAWPGSRELKGLFESLATSSQARDKSGLCLSQSSVPSQSCYCSSGFRFLDPRFQIVPFSLLFHTPLNPGTVHVRRRRWTPWMPSLRILGTRSLSCQIT